MRERPIIFTGAMVRAILSGSKSQTRRVVNPSHRAQIDLSRGDRAAHWSKPMPYGQPGDRLLWVRETFSGPWCMGDTPPSKWGRSSRIWYWADGNPDEGDWTRPRPSIHMPRWASRITLEVTGVRVERLQDISEADALAEGVSAILYEMRRATPRCDFQALWQSINGPDSWAANPWVWVIEFKRINP